MTKDKTATFRPQQMQNILRLAPENFRDQRRRGILDGIGQQDNGRWIYSADDILVIAIAQALFENGIDLPCAMSVAKFAAPSVIACCRHRFPTNYPNPILIALRDGTVVTEKTASDAMVSYQIDIRYIAERLRDRIRLLIPSSDACVSAVASKVKL